MEEKKDVMETKQLVFHEEGNGFRIMGFPERVIDVSFDGQRLTLRIDEKEVTLDAGASGYFLAWIATWYGWGE